MQKPPSSSVVEDDPIREWLLAEQTRFEARLVIRLAARVHAGQRVWRVMAGWGWWVL